MGIRILILLMAFTYSVDTLAQFKADVSVVAIDDKYIAQRIDDAVTKTIDEINLAFNEKRTPVNPDERLISNAVFDNILSLWEVSSFRVTQVELVLDGLHLQNGKYQVRNIPVYFTEESEDSKEREIGFNFDASGKMIDCFLCLELNTYNELMYNGNDVTETSRRQIILHFVEKFRTAYNTKDIATISKVFSESALIIVGSVITEKKKNQTEESALYGILSEEKVKYLKLSKNEYMTRLTSVFRANEYLMVNFDNFKIVKSRQYPDIYGVTLKQTWKSTRYSDVGWLFLMIDFRKKDEPMIHVRTWQPAYLNGKPLPETEIFQIGDFDPGG